MAKTQNQNQTFNVAIDADVAAARAKLVELQGKLAEADRAFRSAAEDSNPARTARSAAVDEALGIKPTAPAPNLNEARERLRVLEAAVTRQRGVIVNADRAASERIAREAKPGYVEIVKRMSRAMADLRKAAIDEKA